MPPPRVSVVVSTYNRPQRLRALLAGLRAQTLPTAQFEVVVVDNGSAPPTGELLEAELAGGGLALRTLRHEATRGPSGGRNSGWRAARAPLVAFTDDDCVPAPQWLAAALAVASERPEAVVQGRTLPAPSSLPAHGLLVHTQRIERLGPQYETCNICYPRSLLERLGGFDESFGLRPAGEDTDLAWRAIEAGHETVFAREAVVYHAVERIGIRGALRIAARWSEGMRVYADHPQTRSMLYRGIFWNVWHYLLWRSLLAFLGPAWARRMLLSLHLRELQTRARRADAGPSAIPFLLVHDAVECWAVARGAIRHRTLVL